MGAIFIVGIYGTGKSYYAKKLGKILNINYYDASALIGAEINHSYHEDKRVSDITFTEQVLFQVIEKIYKREKKFIITGHFCLLKEKGYEVINVEDFNPKRIDKIILLNTDIESIYNNLLVKNIKIKKQTIQKMQKVEKDIAKKIAILYGIPLEIIENNFQK